MAKRKDSTPKGVRGPGGPPPAPRSPQRASLERRSLPAISWLHRLPRWVVVVVPGVMLFFGLVLTGSWAWLGGLLLILIGVFLGWLTALSWPAIGPASRFLRALVVLAVVGIGILKLLGRF